MEDSAEKKDAHVMTSDTGKKESKADAAYDLIKSRIIDGTYSAGFRLALSSLADELDISALPVREAMRRLEAESLVRFERNIGATVAGLSANEHQWTVETLAVLDAAATVWSLSTLGTTGLEEATQINERLRDSVGDADKRVFRSLDQSFHQRLIQSCPNPQIVELVARSWARLSGSPDLSTAAAAACVADHDEILELIRNDAPAPQIESRVRVHHLSAARRSRDLHD